MKKKGHPLYQEILFIDTATGHKFVCGSTLQPKETQMHEGKEYPVYRVPISSASHPFFTGSQQLVDAEGRVDKFKKRYAQRVVQPQGEEKKPQEEGATRKVAKSKRVKKVVAKTVGTKTVAAKTVAVKTGPVEKKKAKIDKTKVDKEEADKEKKEDKPPE